MAGGRAAGERGRGRRVERARATQRSDADRLIAAALALAACSGDRIFGDHQTLMGGDTTASIAPSTVEIRRRAPRRPARAPAHPRRLWRRLRGLAARGRGHHHGQPPGRRLRAAGPHLQGDDPQLARRQRLRAADRPALRHARPARARQRQCRARLRAVARDGARDRAPRRDPRGRGAPGLDQQPGRQRRAERSAGRRAGARPLEDRVRELLALAGVRGRRHRRRHRGACRLRSVRRRRASSPRWAAMPTCAPAATAPTRARPTSSPRTRRRPSG